MLDCALDISEYGLKKHILLFHNLFLIKQLLHGFMITLLGVECKVLQLLLVLTIVEDSLWKDNIFVYLGVEVSQSRPLGGVNLHNIEHHLVLHLLLGVEQVPDLHPLKEAVLLGLQVCNLFLGVHADVAYGGPPPVQIAFLFSDPLFLVLLEVSIFDLCLSFPILFQMFLSQLLHLLSVKFLLFNPGSVFLTTHDCFITE